MVMSRGLDRREAEAALERAAHRALHGTREERSGRVISSALTHIAYNEDSREMDIRFVTGRTYRYFNVPLAVHGGLQSAPSKGAFFNSEIKDRYEFREI
jgi:lysyl-tRNA synthetase class 2